MRWIRTVFFFLFLVLFSGCLSEDKPLKVAVLTWIGYESIYQAEEFGWLDKSIELVKGDIPSDSLRRIMNGEVDAAAMTMEDVLLARAKGVDLSIVAVLDISAGADIVLSKDSMSSLAELKGKRVGHESSALAALILEKTFKKAGLKKKDMTFLDLPPTQQLNAWKNNKVDIVVTYEPYASELLDEGASYVISSREFPEMIFDVLAVRTDRLEGRESSIKKLLKMHFKTLAYFQSNYKDALYRIAAREGTSVEDVKRALGGVVFPSKSANKSFFNGDSSLYRSAGELNALMFENGYVSHKASLKDLTDPEFLKD